MVRARRAPRASPSPRPWRSPPRRRTARRRCASCCCTGIDDRGVAFYTNYESRKGARAGREPARGARDPLAAAPAPGPPRGAGRGADGGGVRRVLRVARARQPARRLGVATRAGDRRPRGARGARGRDRRALPGRRSRARRTGAATCCARTRSSSGRAGRTGCTTASCTVARMTAGAPSASRPERATYLRPAGLDGVEALHASFITHRYRPHSHPTWTLAMVVRGAAAFALDDTAQRAGDGDLFLLEPESVHTGAPAVPGGWAYKVLYLDPGVFGAWAEEGGAPPGGARWVVFRDARLWRALGAAHDALASEPPGLGVDGAVLAAVDALRPHLRPGPRTPADAPRARGGPARACVPRRALGGPRPARRAGGARGAEPVRARADVPRAGRPAAARVPARPPDRAGARAARGRRAGRIGRAGVRLQRPAALHAHVQARGRGRPRRVRKIVQDARRGLSLDPLRWR